MIARIKNGWNLTRKSWEVLVADRSLLLFPIISAVTSFLALLALMLPAAGIYALLGAENSSSAIVFYIGVFIVTLATTFVTVFFNVALVSQVAHSLEGKDTNVRDGISFAWGRKKVVFQWALLAAFVGTVLRIIEDRVPLGAVLSFLGGLVWAVASWFVVPILVFENASPREALERSVETVRNRWGEGVTGVAIIGGVFLLAFLLSLFVFFGLAVLITSTAGPLFIIPLLLVFFPLFVMLFVTSSAMQQIFNTAVFLSISTNAEKVGPFTKEDINGAVIQKQKSLI